MFISKGKDFFSEKDNFYIGDFYASKNLLFHEHTHDHYEVYVCIQGKFEEVCNGEKYTIHEGDFRFVRYADTHELKSIKESSALRNIAIEANLFERIIASFKPNAIEGIFSHFKLSGSKFKDYMKKTEILMYNHTISKAKMVEHIVIDLLIEAMSYKANSREVPYWLEDACERMKEQKNYVAGLNRFVELSGKTQAYLSRQMNTFYQQTPTDYINDIRLKAAIKRLVTTDQLIEDIAYDCGYNNLSYFNRVFKNKYSLTPREYRSKSNRFINFEHMLIDE